MAIQYNSNFDGTMPFSDVAVQFVMTANNELTYTVPGVSTTKYQALFAYNATSNVWVCLNGSVTIPAPGASGTVQYCEFRPEKRYVSGGDVIHVKSSDATSSMGLTLRQLPG